MTLGKFNLLKHCLIEFVTDILEAVIIAVRTEKCKRYDVMLRVRSTTSDITDGIQLHM